MFYLIGALGIAILMVVHESGHYAAARAFGLRVIRYSIGFGPALWRYQSRKTDTIFQVAAIPFFAFVQVAGMNPFEDNDPEDKSSYANASLLARISTIVAGPLANYLFASILFFGSFYIGGELVLTNKVRVVENGAAAAAQMKDGDEILSINGRGIDDFHGLRDIVLDSANKELTFQVKRDGAALTLKVTPEPKGEGGMGLIGVQPVEKRIPMSFQAAATRSITEPAMVVQATIVGIYRIVTRQMEAEISGPVEIGKQLGEAAERGMPIYLWWLGLLSAYLGAFNMLPFPALDGGRFTFLAYEAVTRRRPNAKVEASIHTVGLLALLALITVVTVKEVGNLVTGGGKKAAPTGSASVNAPGTSAPKASHNDQSSADEPAPSP